MTTHPKWEYKLVHTTAAGNDLMAELTALGSEGWELASLTATRRDEYVQVCVLKRPITIDTQTTLSHNPYDLTKRRKSTNH